MKKCDNCKYYNFCYDYCQKWECNVDHKAVYGCFEPIESEVHYE